MINDLTILLENKLFAMDSGILFFLVRGFVETFNLHFSDFCLPTYNTGYALAPNDEGLACFHILLYIYSNKIIRFFIYNCEIKRILYDENKQELILMFKI